jgi:hypothetical protein
MAAVTISIGVFRSLIKRVNSGIAGLPRGPRIYHPVSARVELFTAFLGVEYNALTRRSLAWEVGRLLAA